MQLVIFDKLMDAKDTSYKLKQLPELLDVYSRFNSLEYRGAEWSTSNWGCTCQCVHSLSDCICSHTAFMTLLFYPDFELPESLEEAIPTASKLALKRGITGTKLKRYLAARAAETEISLQKAKKFCPVGLMVRCGLYFYYHVHNVPACHPCRTLLQTRDLRRPRVPIPCPP